MDNQPSYKLIKQGIYDQIMSGQLLPGERLPTEAELMKQYGVSRITVQHALSELKCLGLVVSKRRAGTYVASGSEISEAMQKVMEFSNEGRGVSIGVVAPFNMQKSDAYSYLGGIMNAFSHSQESVLLHNTCYDQSLERIMLKRCIQSGNNGIIYYPGIGDAVPIDLLIQLNTLNYPCVLIDKSFPEVDLPCFQTDNVKAARVMTAHLIGKGHTKIAFLSAQRTAVVFDRYRGYCQEMAKHGLPSLPMFFNNMRENEGEKDPGARLAQLLEQGITAVFCSTDHLAMVLWELCKSMGIDVPGQVAIAGFDGIYANRITSMLQPYEEIGHMAAKALREWIETGKNEHRGQKMRAVLIEGVTT